MRNGVTIAIGYDVGQATKAQFLADWSGKIPPAMLKALAKTCSVTGMPAHQIAVDLRGVVDIPGMSGSMCSAITISPVMRRWPAMRCRSPSSFRRIVLARSSPLCSVAALLSAKPAHAILRYAASSRRWRPATSTRSPGYPFHETALAGRQRPASAPQPRGKTFRGWIGGLASGAIRCSRRRACRSGSRRG